MNALTFILAAVFIVYVVFIYAIFGSLKSISASYYELQKANKGWIFTIFCYSLAVIICFIAGFMQHPMAWSIFLAGGGVAFVGAATRYEQEMTEKVHYIGASVLIFFSVLGIGLVYGNFWPMYILVASGFVMLILRKLIKNPIYWFEILAFVCIIFGLINRL